MSRIHQLYHDLQQERVRSAALRSENHRLRQDRDAIKTQLEAIQSELAALLSTGSPASVEAICTDARQYESLSLARAGVKL